MSLLKNSGHVKVEGEVSGEQPLHVLEGMLTRIGLAVNRDKKARAVCDTAACAKPALRCDGSIHESPREKLRRLRSELAKCKRWQKEQV